MLQPVTLRIGILFLLAITWGIGSACFPVFTPRTNKQSKELRGSVHDEIYPNGAQLFISNVEEMATGRKFHLVLKGYLRDRPFNSGLVFSYEEGSNNIIEVFEKKDLAPVENRGTPVTILHREDYSGSNNDPKFTNVLQIGKDGLPLNILVEPQWNGGNIALSFRYRDQQDQIREGRWVLVPNHIRRHPILAEINKVNYIWTVPADAVIIVSCWSPLIVVLPFIILAQ